MRATKRRTQPAAFRAAAPRRGMPYMLAIGTARPVFWDVTFRMEPEDAPTFLTWFINDLEQGLLEFTLPIRTEFGLLDHVCRFLPDGLFDAREVGETREYSARIMARAQLIPAA